MCSVKKGRQKLYVSTWTICVKITRQFENYMVNLEVHVLLLCISIDGSLIVAFESSQVVLGRTQFMDLK